MCDFRDELTFFNDEKIPLEKQIYNGVIHLTQINNDGIPKIDNLKQGFYLIATTGSFYSYYDGNKFQHEIYFKL